LWSLQATLQTHLAAHQVPRREMLVRVCASEEGSPPEWALVELQGRIEYPGEADNDSYQRDIGMLQVVDQVRTVLWYGFASCVVQIEAAGCTDPAPCCTPQKAGKVQLTIGYHLLEGKRVPLKKPFAVLEKVATSEDTPTDPPTDTASATYNVRACKPSWSLACSQSLGRISS
jgi:hypothetical protein